MRTRYRIRQSKAQAGFEFASNLGEKRREKDL